MKIKTFVSISIIISLFLIGNILLFGLGRSLFFLYYLIFISCIFIIALLFIKQFIANKGDFRFLIIMALILAIPVSFFAENAKAYYDLSYDSNLRQEITSEIEQITAKIEYYNEYIDYLDAQISIFKENSDKLSAQIDKIKAENTPVQRPLTYYYVYEYEDDEYEYEEEDEEDDDD